MPDQPSLLQAMPSKREKRDKSRKEDKNTANKKKRAAAKRFKGSPSALSPSHLPEVALDLHVVFDAAVDVLSEELMGDNPAGAASALALGELTRVVQVVVCSPSLLSPFPLSFFLSLSPLV